MISVLSMRENLFAELSQNETSTAALQAIEPFGPATNGRKSALRAFTSGARGFKNEPFLKSDRLSIFHEWPPMYQTKNPAPQRLRRQQS
jgi:hypothetical protein